MLPPPPPWLMLTTVVTSLNGTVGHGPTRFMVQSHSSSELSQARYMPLGQNSPTDSETAIQALNRLRHLTSGPWPALFCDAGNIGAANRIGKGLGRSAVSANRMSLLSTFPPSFGRLLFKNLDGPFLVQQPWFLDRSPLVIAPCTNTREVALTLSCITNGASENRIGSLRWFLEVQLASYPTFYYY